MTGAASPSLKDAVEARPRVLCVDDEPHILSALRRQLRKAYDVTLIDTPEQALVLLGEQEFEVIISDERMPGMPGHEFLAEAKLRAPGAERILLTGQANPEDVAAAINESGIFRYLQKPWSDADLKSAVEAALNKRREKLREQENRQKTEAQNFRFAEYNRKLSAKAQKIDVELSEANKTLRAAVATAGESMWTMMSWTNPVVAQHGKRVASLVEAMAKQMGLPKPEIGAVRQAALLHDIGKLATGDARSPDPQVACEHALVGSELLASVPGLEYLAQAVRFHHERFVGKGGFPGELSGEEIPIGSRLIAVANAFDHAVYPDGFLKPCTREVGLEELRNHASRYYDPTVVALLIDEVGRDEWKAEEALISLNVTHVEAGMTLAKTLKKADGTVVASQGHVLRGSDVDRIRKLAESDSIQRYIILKPKA